MDISPQINSRELSMIIVGLLIGSGLTILALEQEVGDYKKRYTEAIVEQCVKEVLRIQKNE